MDRNTSQPAGGTDRYSFQRGRAGYAQRPTTYYSTSRLNTAPSSAPVNPSLSQASEAAQRIVLPTFGVLIPRASPTPQKLRINYGGSFDMLTPARAAPSPSFRPVAAPVQPDSAATVVVEQPEPTFQSAPLPAASFAKTGLPTDLIEPVAAEQVKPGSRHRKIGLRLPKFSTPKLLVGMAITLFVAGAAISALSFRTNKQVIAQVKNVTNSQVQIKVDVEGGSTSGVADEGDNPPSIEYYRTSASYPRVIRIPNMKTEARVLALSIASTGALKAPGNIFDAGWYKDSSKPGEAGAMVLDGHVSGPTKPGIFKNLGKLVKGDKIEIERGDGEKFTYTVQATKVFDADKLDMSSVMVPIVPGNPGLNIITCGGKFDTTTNKYEQRTVVYAVIN